MFVQIVVFFFYMLKLHLPVTTADVQVTENEDVRQASVKTDLSRVKPGFNRQIYFIHLQNN